MIPLDGFGFELASGLIPQESGRRGLSEAKLTGWMLDRIVGELKKSGYDIERKRSWKRKIGAAQIRFPIGAIGITMDATVLPDHVVFRIVAFGGIYGHDPIGFVTLKEDWVKFLGALAQGVTHLGGVNGTRLRIEEIDALYRDR